MITAHKTKLLPFLLTAGIRNARTGRLTESPLLGLNPTTHCFGRKETGIAGQRKGRKNANARRTPKLASWSHLQKRIDAAQGRADLLLSSHQLHHRTSAGIETSPGFWKIKPNARFCLKQENHNRLTFILQEKCSQIGCGVHCNTLKKCRNDEKDLDCPSGSLHCPAHTSAVGFSSFSLLTFPTNFTRLQVYLLFSFLLSHQLPSSSYITIKLQNKTQVIQRRGYQKI